MNIRVDLNTPINDGTEVVFRSPVDCSQVTGLIVYYQVGANTASQEFAFADAHGNNVGDIDHLFAENVVVKVILDVTTGMAFVQNADTNAYLEGRFAECANVLKGSVTGKAVGITDVSPLEHEMSVKVDVPSATVTKMGFNWFNQEERFAQLGFVKQEDGSWLGDTYHGILATPPTQVQGAVYVQITAKATSEIGVPISIKAIYTDGTNSSVLQLAKDVTEFTTIKGKTNPDKTLKHIQISYGGNTGNQKAFYIRDVMMSYADGEYVPYTAETQTFTPNADGTVKGIIGNGEPMTLITDNADATITAEYNRDTNKVIESLVQAIISLGGNV